MSFPHWLIAAAIATLPFAASAQQRQERGAPDSADAPAAAITYTSAFKDYRPAADSKNSPDISWRAANIAVTDEKAGPTAAHAPAKPSPVAAAHEHVHDAHAGHGMAHEQDSEDR